MKKFIYLAQWSSQDLNPDISDGFTSCALAVSLYSFCSDLVMWVLWSLWNISIYSGVEYIGMKLWRESWACATDLEVTGILIKALDRSSKESTWSKKKRGCLWPTSRTSARRCWGQEQGSPKVAWHSEMTRKVGDCHRWGEKRYVYP